LNPRILKALRGRTDVEVKRLGVGDYLLTGRRGDVLVERKTSTDLASSIIDGRLFSQIRDLSEVGDSQGVRPLLLLEESPTLVEKFTGLAMQSFYGAIAAIAIGWQIPVVYCPSTKHTVIFLLTLEDYLEKVRKDVKLPFRRVRKSTLTPSEKARAMLEAVVGTQTAINLLKHFRTIKDVVNAPIDALMNVPLVGEKRARELYDVFNTPYRE